MENEWISEMAFGVYNACNYQLCPTKITLSIIDD